MGPGSPEMSGVGHATCRLGQDGLWYVCDFEQEQRLRDGTLVLTWRLHWVTGWDGRAGEYRASSADNQGPNLCLCRARLDGDHLVYESLRDGLPRIRLTLGPGRSRSLRLAQRVHARWLELVAHPGVRHGRGGSCGG